MIRLGTPEKLCRVGTGFFAMFRDQRVRGVAVKFAMSAATTTDET